LYDLSPRDQRGFATRRRWTIVVLLGLFYGVALVLFDLAARKFHIFGLTLWPQDFVYLALLPIMAALSLFFITALAGICWAAELDLRLCTAERSSSCRLALLKASRSAR
jgi:hypothetical protein